MIENGIPQGWRLTAIVAQAAVGMLLGTEFCGLVSHHTLAMANEVLSQRIVSPAEQHAAVSGSQSSASRAFSSVKYGPKQLAIRTARPKNHTHRLRMHNLCNKTVEIVVRYQDHQENWVTQGKTNLPGKTSHYLNSSSSQVLGLSNKLLYYYATSPDSDWVWSGNGSHQYPFGEQILDMRVHYAAKDILDDYLLFILCATSLNANAYVSQPVQLTRFLE